MTGNSVECRVQSARGLPFRTPASRLRKHDPRSTAHESRTPSRIMVHRPRATGTATERYDLARSGDGGRAKSHLCVGEPEAVP